MRADRWADRRVVSIPASIALVCTVLAVGFYVESLTRVTPDIILLAVLGIATRWGMLEAVIASFVSSLLALVYFIPPIGTLSAEKPEDWIIVIVTFTIAVAVSILSATARTRTIEATQRRLEVERLHRLGQALLVCDTSEKVASVVLHELTQVFGARSAAFYLPGINTPLRIGEASAAIGEDILREAARTQTFIVDPASGATIAPLRAGEETVGSLGVLAPSLSRPMLTSVCNLVTPTLGRVQASEKLLRLAHDIQMGLLPKRFSGFSGNPMVDLFATITPALEVGGDFYDFFLLDAERLCFVIGDVADKGVPAALFMAMTLTAFEISATSTPGSPARVLSLVNRFLCENNESQMFVTMFAGILDARTGKIQYSDGGHEPPFIMRRGGAVEMLDKVGGLALGVIEDYSFRDGTITLNPGDTLVLYTDGVNEAMNGERQLFRVTRLNEALREVCDGVPAEHVAGAVMRRVHEFTGGAPQSDDITILVARYPGPEGLTAGHEDAGQEQRYVAARTADAA